MRRSNLCFFWFVLLAIPLAAWSSSSAPNPSTACLRDASCLQAQRANALMSGGVLFDGAFGHSGSPYLGPAMKHKLGPHSTRHRSRFAAMRSVLSSGQVLSSAIHLKALPVATQNQFATMVNVSSGLGGIPVTGTSSFGLLAAALVGMAFVVRRKLI